MKHLFILLALVSGIAKAAPVTTSAQYELDRMNTVARKHSLGTRLREAHSVAKVTYTWATGSGAVGDTDTGLTLPAGAIVTRAYVEVLTQPTSGGSATVALKLGSAGDILAATAKASLTAGFYAGVPDGTVTHFVKVTSDTNLKMTVATAALTGGKFRVYLHYFISE